MRYSSQDLHESNPHLKMDADSGAETGRNTTASKNAWMLIACLPGNSSLYASVQSAHRSIELRCRNSNDWRKLVFYEICRLESVSSHCTISKNAVGVVTWKWLCRPIPGQCRLLQCKDNPGCVWLSRNFDPILRCEVFTWSRARIWCFNSKRYLLGIRNKGCGIS